MSILSTFIPYVWRSLMLQC